ncbi:hypothetical protein OAK75_00230 [Bacteriovoracales bacterium]|nr:hypothetical protein [Bacteriovoracales bacterium]
MVVGEILSGTNHQWDAKLLNREGATEERSHCSFPLARFIFNKYQGPKKI